MSLLVKPVTISAVSIIASFRRNELSRTQRKACPKWDSPDTNGVPIDYPTTKVSSSAIIYLSRKESSEKVGSDLCSFPHCHKFRMHFTFRHCYYFLDVLWKLFLFHIFFGLGGHIVTGPYTTADYHREIYLDINFLAKSLRSPMLRITSYSFGNNVHRASTIANLKERQR